LFSEMQIQIGDSEMALINVDATDTATNSFLQKIGLTAFISQYEMIKL